MGTIHKTYLVCDRCGKEAQVLNEFAKAEGWDSGMELSGRIFAYCPECIKKINKICSTKGGDLC